MAESTAAQKIGVVAAAVVAIVALAGLFYKGSSGPPVPNASLNLPTSTPATNAKSSGVDLQCLTERVQKAPAPFHLSFKKSTKVVSTDLETNVTPNSINGTVIDGSGTREIHAVRSDSAAWNLAVVTVTAPISGAASTLNLARNSSAMSRVGAEEVHGQQTVKYAIDTGHDNPADATAFRNIMGHNGFLRGSAWVTGDGCPVKLVLDAQMAFPDGTVEEQHFESNVTQGQ